MKPQDFTILVDSREQQPLKFSAEARIEVRGLTLGDYSVRGLERFITVERKSVDDLLLSLTQERQRFEREISLMRSIPFRSLVVEGVLADILSGRYRSRATPRSVLASLASWSGKYCLPVVFAGDSDGAAAYVEEFLAQAVRNIKATYEAAGVISVLDEAARLTMSGGEPPRIASDFI